MRARWDVVGAALAACALAACAPQGDDAQQANNAQANNVATGTDAPGFAQLHHRIFEQPSCSSMACHGGERGIAGLSFDDPQAAYDRLVSGAPTNSPAASAGMKLVDPGAPDNSFLLTKLEASVEALAEAGHGAPMPMTGSRLGPQSLAAVRAWIQAGAPYEGADFEPDFLEGSGLDEAYVQCDAADEAGLRDCFEAVPSEGTYERLYSPPIEVPAESEVIMCSYLEVDPDEDWYITATQGQQMTGGHHIAVFMAVNRDDDPTPHECTDEEMTNFNFVAGAGGGGGQDTVMPEGRALRVPAGRQLVIQSHYLNTSKEPRLVMDAVDLKRVEFDESLEIVDPFAMIYSDFVIPPGEELEHVKECTVNKPRSIYTLLGHTHDYGVLFEFELEREGSGEPELLYRATDGPLLRDNPEIKQYDPPLQVEPGDTLRMRCKWNNTTDEPLGWPEEMCVGLMYYGPGEGWLTCSNEQTKPRLGGDEDGCASPLDQGNELGVGKYCTRTGRECSDNEGATLCLAPFDPSSNFCSKIGCESDEECGAGARCHETSQGSACVPDKCFEG